MKKLSLVLVALLIGAVSFSQTNHGDLCTGYFSRINKEHLSKYSIDSLEIILIKKINKFRDSNNISSVISNSDLNRYCEEHSQNQLQNGDIYHSDISSINAISENVYIQKVYGSWWLLDLIQTTNQIFDSWITSKLHNRNMLVPGSDIGIAIELYPINNGAGYDISCTMVIR